MMMMTMIPQQPPGWQLVNRYLEPYGSEVLDYQPASLGSGSCLSCPAGSPSGNNG